MNQKDTWQQMLVDTYPKLFVRSFRGVKFSPGFPTCGDGWCDILSETEVEKYTLAQYEHVRSELGALTVYDEQRGLKIARAAQRIRDIVAEHAKSNKVVNRRDARFVTEGRKPAEHVHQSRLDLDESERPLSGHVFSQDGPKSAPPDARGPHRERVLPTPKFEPQFPPQLPQCPTSPPTTLDDGPSPAVVSQRALTGRRRPTSGKADV